MPPLRSSYSFHFSEHFVDKFDTPKNSKLAKISGLKYMFKKPYPTIRGSKFKLDRVESENSYVLLIDAINFKLR